MIDTQLNDYIKVYKGFYSISFCIGVIESLKNAQWELHSFYSPTLNSTKSYDNEPSVLVSKFPLKNQLDQDVKTIINKYVSNVDMPWFSRWNGYVPCKINKYDQATKMRLHCDHIHSIFDGKRKGVPVLTIIGTLNEDYDGGELVLCGKTIELKTGDVVVFPSNFMYPHEVKPIILGTRYSFVSWAW